jgi:hypothetical protein
MLLPGGPPRLLLPWKGFCMLLLDPEAMTGAAPGMMTLVTTVSPSLKPSRTSV